MEINSNNFGKKNTLNTVAKAFMIVGCVCNAFIYLIPLAWCIPMTIYYWKKIDNDEDVGIAFKICSLLFVNLVAGILMLCDN